MDAGLRGSSWGTATVLARQHTASAGPCPGLGQTAWGEGVGRAQAAGSGPALEAASPLLPEALPASSPRIQATTVFGALHLTRHVPACPRTCPGTPRPVRTLSDPPPPAHSSLEQGTGADGCRGQRRSLVLLQAPATGAGQPLLDPRSLTHAHSHTHQEMPRGHHFWAGGSRPGLPMRSREAPTSQRKVFPRWDQEPHQADHTRATLCVCLGGGSRVTATQSP